MRIIGLAGWSGSGKTTLLAKIIPRLVARGYTVSTVKHAHHNFDVDTPGKDSHVHRMAGASRNSCISAQRRPEATSTSVAPAIRWVWESLPGVSTSKP